MINLFKGYAAAKDANFVKYIETKKDMYDEGKDITSKQLMRFALNRYKNRCRAQLWGALTPEEKQIVAMSANLNKLKDQNLQLSKSIKTRKGPADKGKGRQQQQQAQGGGDSGQSGNATPDKKERTWMLIAPKEGEPHHKTVKGFEGTMYWCPKHKKWGGHKPDACEKKKKRLEKEKKERGGPANNRHQRNKAYAATLTALMEDVVDSDSD